MAGLFFKKKKELERELLETREEREGLRDRLTQVQQENDVLRNQLAMARQESDSLRNQLSQFADSYNVIRNAFFWHLTGPIRKSFDFLKHYRVPADILRAARSAWEAGAQTSARKLRFQGQAALFSSAKSAEEAAFPVLPPFKNAKEWIRTMKEEEAEIYLKDRLEKAVSGEAVLLITHELNLTGAPIVLGYLADCLTKQKKNVVVVSKNDGALRQTFVDKGIPVIVMGNVYGSDLVPRAAGLFRLVVVNTIVGAPLIAGLSRTDTPVLWWIHEARASYIPEMVSALPETVGANVHIYCVTAYAKRILLEHRPQYHAELLPYYIPDFSKIPTDGVECVIAPDDKRTVFINVGSQEERKGQDVLAQALSHLSPSLLKKCLFVFVGKKHYKPIFDSISAALDEYPDNVLYIPEFNRTEIAALYKRTDCLICTSKDDPMPAVTTEAMTCSKLVICSETVGAGELIKETGSGIVYGGNDPRELADCITRVAEKRDSEEARAEMKRRGRETYERLFSEQVFDRHIARLYRILADKTPLPVDGVVSVVIPTYNAGNDLRPLLKSLSGQKGVPGVEIVVVDSGSTDGTAQAAEEAGAIVVPISQAEFSHSYARNLGAEKASGKYVLFMTQDALPSSEYWIRDLAQPILRGIAVAASCRQVPRDDCDLFGRVSIWQHTGYMGILDHDRILSMPKNGGAGEMRQNGQIDDVSCLIRKDVFSRFQYRGSYAEDLDLGLRLIRFGYRLAMLSGVAVVHSHTRPAYYHMRRCMVDITVVKQILPDMPTENLPAVNYINRVISVYAALKLFMTEFCAKDETTGRKAYFGGVERYFTDLMARVQKMSYKEIGPILDRKIPYDDKALRTFVRKAYDKARKTFRPDIAYISVQQFMLTRVIPDYLAYNGEKFSAETKENVADYLVKLTGRLAGEGLGHYNVSHKGENKFLDACIKVFMKGI